jgi:phage terminase large subunit-like protein
MIGKDCDKNYYIFGNYIVDEEGRQLSRFRKKVGVRNQLILDQANLDGSDTTIVLPQDPAQAGKIELEQHSKDLQGEGFLVKKDPMAYNKGKIKKFEPFCAACHNGYVFFVVDSFDRKVLDYLYLELENFDGNKNNGYKDDLLDSAASAFNFISRERISKPVSIPNMNNPTLLSNHRSRTK